MVDPCHLNPLQCLNNGRCIGNISLNTTYCQCAPCYIGHICQIRHSGQQQFDTTYVYWIIFTIEFCLSLLNNSLSLELFIRCRRIRHTNCGIYLTVYSILSLVSITFVVVDQGIQYYPNQLFNNEKHYSSFYCYVVKIGSNALNYMCIWISSCVALERGLVIWFYGRMSTTRWRSLITITFLFTLAGGCATPMLMYKCDWDNIPSLQTARHFFDFFFMISGIIIYVLATVLVLMSFTRRIRRYGTENGSFIKTFLKLLHTHLFIFVPPIAYAVGYVPYTILYKQNKPGNGYYQCGISTQEFVIKVIIQASPGVPFVITWLLFVYPSRVYMNEFYLNTWSGQRLAKILLFLKGYNDRRETDSARTMNPANNQHDTRELHREN